MVSQVRGPNPKKTEVRRCVVSVEEGGGRDEARAHPQPIWGPRCVLSRTRPAQYGVPGAWSQPEEGGGGDEAELGSQVRARQGRGRSAYPQPIWGPRCESGGGDEAGALILDQRGVPGTRSRPEEGEGG
ncbi:unnamed protein product, partial [Symbiodinium sp. CCMP2592]